MKTGVELIAEERKEQIEKHQKTVLDDILMNDSQELRIAARKLLLKKDGSDNVAEELRDPPKGWDKEVWRKMYSKGYKERMIIAGALIAAEIDRIS